MKKILIICLTGFMTIMLYGQEKIKLVPYDFQEKIKISKLNSSPTNDKINDLIYSKNELNAVSSEVNPADINKAQKIQLNIIKLYNKQGNLLATSQPIDLYDWIVKPMGDDKTVLVIFPAGTAQKAIIKFLKISGNSLVEIKEIVRETSYFNFDIDNKGEKLIASYSPYRGKSALPELKLYDNNGNEIWSKTVDEKDIYSIKISNDYIVAASQDLIDKVGYVYSFNYNGNRKMKSKLNSIEGTYQIEYSDDETNQFFAISTSKNIELFDSKSFSKIKSIESKDSNSRFKSYIVDKNGNIVAATDKKIVVETINNQNDEIEIKVDGNPRIKKEKDKIVLEMWNPKEQKYYEIQY